MNEHTTPVGQTKPLTGNCERLFRFMVSQARMRDRVYFCSDQTAAAALGLSRHTILRCRQRLEEHGRIERAGTRKYGHLREVIVYRFCKGVKRLLATQRSSTNSRTAYRTTPLSFTSFTTGGLFAPLRTHGRRRVTTDLATTGAELPPETAQTIVKDVIDAAKATGMPVSSRFVGILAKQVKELLSDGFSGDCLRQASAEAIRQRRPHMLFWIASDLAVAQAGQLRSERSYRKMLQHEAELAEARETRLRLFG